MLQYIHSCTIAIPGAPTGDPKQRDRDGEPARSAPTITVGAICLFGDLSTREIANLTSAGTIEQSKYLMLPRYVEIKHRAIVTAVTHRLSGVVEDTGPLVVDSINTRRAGGRVYRYCTLRRVGGTGSE